MQEVIELLAGLANMELMVAIGIVNGSDRDVQVMQSRVGGEKGKAAASSTITQEVYY